MFYIWFNRNESRSISESDARVVQQLNWVDEIHKIPRFIPSWFSTITLRTYLLEYRWLWAWSYFVSVCYENERNAAERREIKHEGKILSQSVRNERWISFDFRKVKRFPLALPPPPTHQKKKSKLEHFIFIQVSQSINPIHIHSPYANIPAIKHKI